MTSNRRIVLTLAGVALLVTLGAGAAYLMTGSIIAYRLLWMAGPIALTATGLALVQTWLPKD